MFSFRKIINILVLISYVKMTIVSSFAMDSAYFGLNDKIRIQITKNQAGGELESMGLRVFTKDKASSSNSDYKLVQQDSVDLVEGLFSNGVMPLTGLQQNVIQWTIPGLGSVIIDPNGEVTFKEMTNTHNTIKIVTPGIVMFQACALANVSLRAQGSAISDGSHIGYLKARLSNLGSLMLVGNAEQSLGHLDLFSGHLHNFSQLSILRNSRWNLHGNAAINYANISIGATANFVVDNSLFFVNLNRISGNRLVLLGRQNAITEEDVATQMALMTSMSTLLPQLLSTNQFPSLTSAVLNYLVPVIGQGLNLGTINVQNLTSNRTKIKNAEIGSITITDGSQSKVGILKNEGLFKTLASTGPVPLMFRKLSNDGVLDYASKLIIAQSKFGTASRLIAGTTEAIQFLTPTILRGTLAQVMPMTLHGRVTNNAIFDVLPDLLSPSFTLNVDGSFDNHTSMEMAHDLFLTGAGIFTNYAELKTKRFVASAMVANRNLIAATDIQVDSPAFSNSEGRVVASNSVQITGHHLDNNKGQIFAGGKVTTRVKSLDNTNGIIDGVGGTDVTLTGTNFNGADGRIGNVGETNLTFAQDATVEDIGTVAGDKTHLKQDKTGRTVTINSGVVDGKTIAHILLSNITANVDFATPLLYISSPNWRLSNQAQAARTMVSVLPTQNYQLINPYRTKGTLELWQNGIHNLTDIEKHWESLYGDKTKDKPAATHTVSILASLQADRGLKFYLPQATLHINDNVVGDMTELLCPDSQLHMRVAKFDLERGCVAALTADSWAAHGHHIGSLVEDPTRKVFASFFDNEGTSHNLGWRVRNPIFTARGQVIPNVYDGAHLLIMPYYTKNGSALVVKQKSNFRGHINQESILQLKDTSIDSDVNSTFTSALTEIDGDLEIKGTGEFNVEGGKGVLDFTGLYCHETVVQQCKYLFALADESSFRITGDVLSPSTVLFNLTAGSLTASSSKNMKVNSTDLTTGRKQKIVIVGSEEWDLYQSARYVDQSLYRKFFEKWRREYRERNFVHAEGHERRQAYAFHAITKGLAGAQKVFPAHISFTQGGVMSVAGDAQITNISTPLMIVARDQAGRLVLGSNNPYFIPPADPVRNLMNGKFHSFNIHLTPDLRSMLDRVNAPQFLFSMRARFWHDDAASQEFYAPIINDVVVHHPRDGFRKIQGRTVFSLSPDLLLERVRSEVQTVLLRGYVDDNTTIDLAYLQQLHRNASEYFRECTLDAPSVSRALVSGRAHTLPDVTKPMLIYTSMINEQGVEELSPRLIIPPAMIDEMRKAKGGYVRTNVLAILDNTVTLDEALHLYRDQPKLVADLKRYAEQNPDSVAQWDARAKRAKELKGDPLATEKMLQEFGSTTLLGTIKVGQLGINTSTPLFIRADIDAQDAFLKSLCDIMIQSEKGRVYTSRENFYERITTQARIHVAGLLKIITAENLTMESVKTHSGLGTEMKALGSIFDIPIELISHSVMVEHGKKKTTRTETTRTTNVGSNHSSDATISQTAGANILHQKVHYEAKEKLRFTAGENIESRDAHDTEQTKRETTKEGTFRTKTTTECSGSSTSKSSTYKTADAGFKAERGNATFTNTIFDCLTTNIETLQGLTSFLLGVNDAYYSCVKSSMGAAWSRTSMINEQHRTYAQSKILGKMHVHSKETLIQLVEGQSQEILDLIEVDGGPVVKQFLKEMHKHERKVIQGPGQALMAIIAIAMTILTQGAAAPLAAKIGLGSGLVAKAVMGAVLSAVGTQLTAATMQNKGNPFKAAKTLATKEFLKSLAIKMASAGLTAGVMAHFKIEVPDASATDHLSNADLFLKQMAYSQNKINRL